MKNKESKLNNEFQEKNEEIKVLKSSDNIKEEKIILNNELLSSLLKNPPNFEKKYKNEELNKFKDEILNYLSERNQHYMSLIRHFQDKQQDTKKEFLNKVNIIYQNYNSILSSQALLNNKIDKISNFELFINKTNDQLITHEIRLNNLSSDFIKSTQKYDKIYLDNLELPGYIGKFSKFKNCQAFFENIIREIDKMNQYKEKNNLDNKAYKEKLDGIIKSFSLLLKNNNESQLKYIKQLNDNCFKECKELNDQLNNRVCDLRIENAKYSIELVKKNEEMNKEWKKILEIKENLMNLINEKINNFSKIFYANNASFNAFKKEYEEFKVKINEIFIYFKEVKTDKENNNLVSNISNNSTNNLNGCFISSALPLEKKNFKNFPRKFFKRAKTKNKYLEKKQYLKNISTLNANRNNTTQLDYDNKKCNIINIERLEDNLLIPSKERHKKRNIGNSLHKEKTFNSIDKKYNIENQSRRTIHGLKEPRSSKTTTKIEINSHNKASYIDASKIDKMSKLNENANDINNINNDLNKENSSSKRDEKIIIHKSYRKGQKIILESNKSIQSEDTDNSKMNENINTLCTTNDLNYSLNNNINNANNVNKFILNEDLMNHNNNHVIKELASELEQSTNKKDKLNSSKKKIEDNFKLICNRICPLNININKEIKDNSIYENNNQIENDNKNGSEGIKLNTTSTEKTEEQKDVIYPLYFNQNDLNSINKKMGAFDKKLIDLEFLLKQKMAEFLKQFDKLQNTCYYLLNYRKNTDKKFTKNDFIRNISSKVNLTEPNENINNYIKVNNSNDDYFVHSHSVKKLAPIVEIDPNNLEFSLSPSRKENIILSNRKNKEKESNRIKENKKAFCNNFLDIKIVKKNENKENNNTNSRNIDYFQYKIHGKNMNNFDNNNNKWINSNIKYDKS